MNHSELLQKVSNSDRPVILDFWAEWCGPCKTTSPILEKLAQEYSSSLDFIAVDVDRSRPILEHYKVMAVPTVVAIRDGIEVGRMTGVQTEPSYRRMFQNLTEGKELQIGIAPFERSLRLGAGTALIIIGLITTTWLLVGFGTILAFLGVYDRCPIWKAFTTLFTRK